MVDAEGDAAGSDGRIKRGEMGNGVGEEEE